MVMTCGTVTEHVVFGTEMVLVPTTTAPLSAADIHTQVTQSHSTRTRRRDSVKSAVTYGRELWTLRSSGAHWSAATTLIVAVDNNTGVLLGAVFDVLPVFLAVKLSAPYSS